jgi:hypothetical protein
LLFKRVWQEDVLAGSRCGGSTRLIAVVQDGAVIEKILRYLICRVARYPELSGAGVGKAQ